MTSPQHHRVGGPNVMTANRMVTSPGNPYAQQNIVQTQMMANMVNPQQTRFVRPSPAINEQRRMVIQQNQMQQHQQIQQQTIMQQQNMQPMQQNMQPGMSGMQQNMQPVMHQQQMVANRQNMPGFSPLNQGPLVQGNPVGSRSPLGSPQPGYYFTTQK